MLIDSPHRDDNLLGVRPPGPSPGDAVSIKSSKDKRPKRSPGETLTREGRGISARSGARTYDLDGDLCAATGCPARGGRPGQITQARSPGSVTALRHRPAGAGQLTGVRRRARRASARRGAAGRRPTVRRLGPPLPLLWPWWRSVRQSRILPDGSRAVLRPIRPGGPDRLARRRCALEAVEKVVTEALD